MMNHKYTLLFVMSLLLWTSCGKKDEFTTEWCFLSRHHERVIPDVRIYLTYNTIPFPGYNIEGNFNEEIVTDENGEICRTLPIGNHWAIAYGYDSLLQVPIRGSMQIQVKQVKIKRDTTIFVSEF